MTIPDSAKATYVNLTSIALSDVTPPANNTAYFYATKYRHQLLSEAYRGSLWLYPVAGSILILCACQSLIRYHFVGPMHWINHGITLGMGSGLGLLGFLNIGSSTLPTDYEIWKTAFFAMALDDLELDNLMEPDDLKPVYNLVSVDWAVAIVFLAYLLTTLLTSVSGISSELTEG
ncbi:unnamed protein product [Cutaneotrichosporon oleaginosum]